MHELFEQQKETREKVQQELEKAESERLRKRLAHSAVELCRGNVSVLLNREIFQHIPMFLTYVKTGNNPETLSGLMVALRSALASKDDTLRERGLVVISMVLKEALQAGNQDNIGHIFAVLSEWMEKEAFLLPGYEFVSQQMREAARKLQEFGSYGQLERYVRTLNTILNHKETNSNAIQVIAERSLKLLSTAENHALLFSELITGSESRRIQVEGILLALGEDAMGYLVSRLSDEGFAFHERELLIGFLVRAGRSSVEAIDLMLDGQVSREFAQATMRILREVKVPVHSNTIEKYFQNRDLIVQREAVKLLISLERENAVQRLIEATDYFNMEVLVEVVRYLSGRNNKSIATCFQKIVKDVVANRQRAEKTLLTSLIVGLQNYPSPATVDVLWNMLNHKSFPQDLILRRMLNRTIRNLENTLFHTGHRIWSADDVDFYNDPEAKTALRSYMADFNEEIDSLIDQDKRGLAVSKLVEKARWLAAEKDFAPAEYLLDRILKIDADAVSAVIALEACLEREKRSSVPASVLKLWEDLVIRIGSTAFSELFNGFVIEQYSDGEPLAKRGDYDNRLYFIHSGSISIWIPGNNGETFIKKCRPGEIVGGEVVFSVSYWTVTLRAERESRVFVLDREKLKKLESSFPGITAELKEYCSKFSINEVLLKTFCQDRRCASRIPVNADIPVTLLDSYGNDHGKTIRCKMVDISPQGACWKIRIVNAEKPELMLGRTALANLPLPDGEQFLLQGEIVGLHRASADPERFRMNLRLDEPIGQKELATVINQLRDTP